MSFSKAHPDSRKEILQQATPQESNVPTSTTSDIASAVGGLLDFIPYSSQGEDPEEERFRHQMQRKKKKRGRRM